MSVDRLVAAFTRIAARIEHPCNVGCNGDAHSSTCLARRDERVLRALASRTVEALEEAHSDGAADDWGRSIGLWETVMPIFERVERLADTPEP